MSRVRTAAPLALLAGLGCLELLGGRHFLVLGMLVVAPLLAATYLSTVLTAAYAVLTVLELVALGAVTGLDTDGPTGAAQTVRVLGALFGGLVAIVASRSRERRERTLAQVSRVAAAAQEAILSPVPASLPGLAVRASYQSSAREATMGGDLYEAVATPYGVRLLLGDVRGHGLGAVRLASRVLGCFRALAPVREDLATLLTDLDGTVTGNADGEDFVTAVLVQLRGRELVVLNAGHPAPLLVREGEAYPLAPDEPERPLGLRPAARARSWLVEPGDRLLLFTDGLTEARHHRSREFFPAAAAVARTLGRGDLDEGFAALHAELSAWTGGRLDDDLALVLLEVSGADQPVLDRNGVSGSTAV